MTVSPAKSIINDITSGIGMGMVTVVIIFVGLLEIKTGYRKEV